MRLIDADALIKRIQEEHKFGSLMLSNMISEMPTVEVKHGEWKLDLNGKDWNLPAWRCSLCHAVNNNIGVIRNGVDENPLMWAGSNFCPQCGADMRGDENETTN